MRLLIFGLAVTAAATGASGCRLEPRGSDDPGFSVHILPAGSEVPKVEGSTELLFQIKLNDGLDDKTFMDKGGKVERGTGFSGGNPVRYWSFGLIANNAPSPIYFFVDAQGNAIDHLPMVEVLPGDVRYSPLHNIYKVEVTSAYDGELITSREALADAVELGLIKEPVASSKIISGPLVLPNTTLEVSDAQTTTPTKVYARGVEATMFRFPGEISAISFIPTNQVSFLRQAGKAVFDSTRPVFQATLGATNYTPLSVVVNVDLAQGQDPTQVTSDNQMFARGTTGAITDYSNPPVSEFNITTQLQLLQLQTAEGQL